MLGAGALKRSMAPDNLKTELLLLKRRSTDVWHVPAQMYCLMSHHIARGQAAAEAAYLQLDTFWTFQEVPEAGMHAAA